LLSLQSSSLGTEKTYERVNNMRKLSIKTLSLVLSLLLTISVFSVLSFSAGAEAEATPGDLNGDGKVDQTDIDLLEAALTSGQGANESYDVSGNRIVGSDDLIVLKNMVDSNEPALEDKLADGETEDILSLVTSTEGGAAQSAIVRGYSTKALEMNATGNMTVLFAESQDWSGKVTLEMDTLWLAGERTVTVALLGADGKTVLGRPGMVAAQENGWSRIYVPLTGVTARERAEVGGIVVSVAADAHVYLDNLSLAEAPESDITRADLEAALVEVAWDYHLKGGKVQYDSTELTTRGDVGSEEPMSKAYGGTWRTNTFSSLEDATSDSTVFSVCSDYCWNVYYEALGYPVLGHRVNAVTRGLFMNSEYPQDMVVARWWDDGYNTNDSRWADFGNSGSVRTPAETLVDMIKNYDTYLRPGDILVAHGNGGHQHAMLYVGDGKILHCGGGKFNLATGADDVEEDGAVNLATIKGTFLADGEEQGGYFVLENAIADTNVNGAWFVIVRPLDVLTVDDTDADAANDKLDLGYVLDTGKLEYELANNDLSPVPTTGFTITESTYSRMQYPGMDIDRTVSVKNYGTVAKGGQLTYTITITNNSNNTDFPTAATAYSGLTVTETVPANTTYVSNVGGGTVAGGKITWTVDVPAGSSKTVSYTVTASGNVGDKIVCGDGKVANIPSNVLTTTIGGQKWTASELNAFVNSTVEAGWNSNDGYKISANAAQETGFAERVYNEVTGLDLQLPGIQELADNFFTQTRIHQPYGLHYYYNTARTRHMYVLNDRNEMAEEYRIYRDMLVEGYFGGVWVYSNDYNKEPRIIDPRAKYLEDGDILVYMNLEGSVSGGTDMEDRDVTDWRVLVYLGSDTYASLESNGRMRKVTGDSPALAGLMYDMFLALRPSQAYENLNTAIPAYTATAPDLTAEDASYVYQVAVSDVLLNDTNAAKITALTADEGWTSMNLGFATQVYKKIGLDIGTDGIKGASYATVVLNCFNATSGSWLKPYNYTFREEPVVGKEELHAMVMLYGGTCFNNPVALTSLSQLHVGDVILMGYRDYSAYLCAVYQGEGNFLVVTQQKEKVTSGSQVTNWFQKNIASDSALTSWLGEAINSSVSSWRKYEGYVVLRPSRAFDDINEMAVRDMSEGRLTEAEKQALSNLTVDNWLEDGRSYQLSNFVNWAYKAAKVDVSAEMGGKTANGGHSAIFKKVSGKLTPMTDADDAYNAIYAAMSVPGLYGGANVAEHPDRILTAADLQVGDVFVSAKFLSAGNYLFWIGLYQGNGQFLLFESTSADAEYKARTTTTEIIGQDFSQDWMYYYVLRPDWTVKRKIEDGALTADELLGLKELTKSDLNVVHPGTVTTKIYGTVSIDVSDIFSTYTYSDILKKLMVDSTGQLNDASVAEYDADYHAMLVPGYYGGYQYGGSALGRAFVPEDFKVGDIFMAYGKAKCGHETTGFNVVCAVYLGDGKFLSISRNSASCETCHTVYIDSVEGSEHAYNASIFASVADLSATTGYKHFFVLRPERLAPDALQSIALDQTSWTAAEAGDTVTLNVTKNPAAAAPNANITWVSSDESIAKVEDGVVTAIRGGTCTITAYIGGNSASCTVTVPARAITTGALIPEELAAIASYNRTTAGGTLSAIAEEVYALAGINLDPVTGSATVSTARTALIVDGTGVLIEGTTDWHKMLVPGTNGGSKNYATEAARTARTFTPADFKVGDIFAAMSPKCADSKWPATTAVYLGNGKFSVSVHADCSCKVTYIDDIATMTDAGLTVDGHTSIWAEDVTVLNTRWLHYFVLRPERLAADALQSISLNETELALEKNATATLTVTKAPVDAAPNTAVTWVSSNENAVTVVDGKLTAVGVGTATITAYCDGNSASCTVTVSARSMASGALTTEEMAAISNLTSLTTVGKNPGYVADEIYSAVGIDISGLLSNQGITDIYNLVSAETESDYTKMLLAGYTGGSDLGEYPNFIPNDLKIGDLFIAYARVHCAACNAANTLTAVYIGDGQFLVAPRNIRTTEGCATCGGCYVDDYADLENNTYSIWGEKTNFTKYFVLRPERLAVDAIKSVTLSETELTLNYTTANSLPKANAATLTYVKNPATAVDPERVTWTTSNPDVATVVDGKITAVGAGTCTITVNCDGYTATCQVTVSRTADARGSLTATEQAALQAFTGEGNTVFADFAKSAYTAAGIDISPVFAKYGFYDLARKNFDVDGGTYDLLAADALTEEQAKFRKMLMFDYYGGSKIAVGKTFTPENFEIGDLFFAVRKCPTTEAGGLYIAGIYQGDGNFLIYEHHPAGCGGTCRSLFTDEYDVTEETVVWGTSAEMKTIQYYFVLRPSRLAMRHISDGALTATEQEALASYSREEMGGTLSQVAIDAYTQAGIVVDFVFEKASISTARTALLNDSTGALIEGDTVWHKMLVAGSNGGKANAESAKTFTQADFQVGDIFCAIGQCEHSKWPAVTAVYLGNGKFQVSSHASCDCLASYVDDIANVDETGVLTTNGRVSIWAEADALKYVWKHFFVLRPSQLAE